MATPQEVAQWMLSQLEEDDELRQQDAAFAIKERFGDEFVYLDRNGDLAISRKVLYRFKKLTGDAVVWVCPPDNYLEGFWRWREKGDEPGRRQRYW